uniref:BRCT domain-containing protein n=1 Tax=Caenorhabditis japonica TaxID=281687 RepID=A0A8R1DV72_CAEJA
MKIVIFLLFLFLFDSHSLAAPPPDTPAFSIFVDQLSIVARISNAIAIQTELITNSTDIEAVMKELIPGHSGFLPLVRQVNVSQAIKILDWLTEEIIAVKTVVNKITKDRLQECLKVINFLTENVGILEDLKEYKELTAEKFYSAVQDLNATKPFKLCSKEVLEQVSAFYELNYYKRQEHGHNILNLFHNLSQIQHTLDYGKCISNLQSFHDRLEKLPLYTSFTNLPKIKKVKNVEQVFEQKFNKFSLLGNSSEIVQKSMGEMKGIWSKLPLEFDSNGIDHIITFYSQHWYYANLGRMRKTMTSGFFLPMDTIQVKEDLKSSFFKNRIAQKKSVSGLTKALNFYLKFAAESAKLEKAFAESVHFITNQIPIIERMNKTIEALIYFDSKDILKRLEDLTRDTKECTEKLVISLQDFSEFEQAHNYATKIFNNMRRLRNLSIAANKDVVSEKYEQLLKDFQKVESELDEEKVVHWLTEYQKSFDFPFAMDVSKLLVEFKDAFETLENDIKEFQKSKLNNKSFLVKNQINSSSLFTFLECYKSKMVSLDLFKQSALFLLNSTNILDDAMVNATRSFFIHLKNIQEAQNTVYVMEKEKADFPESRVLLDFKNSLDLSESFGKGVMALREIRDVVKNQTLLLDLDKLSKTSMVLIKSAARKPTQEFFLSRKGDIQNFQKSLFALEEAAILSVDTNLTNTKPVFKAAQKVIGFNITKFEITEAAMLLELSHEREDSKRLKDLSQLHLDFASSRHFLDGATISAKLLNDQFEHFLGFREEKSKTVIIKELPTVLIIVFIGVILLSVCACLVGYGFTKNGRAKCKNYWLQYFGKPQDFEKRWRYALFMDTVEDKNVVIDCAREVNPVNLKKVLTRGAYVNVYSRYGNTALHTATQRGYSEIVRILITHGADRSLLNYQNKTAEQMLPKESDYKKMDKKVAKRFRETAQLYKKLRMKKYRIRVPREFPVSSYHIYMEDRTDDDLTDAFMDKFQHITSDEALPTTTHCICHTTADGVLETDNFEVLYWVFHGAIIVQERWMTDCLKNPKLIEKDENYLVQHVKYNSVMYRNSVLPWTRAMAKGTMPYLQGVYILMVMQKCSYLTSLTNIIPKLGAVLLTTMPSLETFNKGAHPYLHARNNPVWILHDNTLDLSAFKDDPNHLFTIISEQEFIALLLRRDIDQNKNKDPVPAVTVQDDFI